MKTSQDYLKTLNILKAFILHGIIQKIEKSIINAISLLKKVGFDLKHNVSFYVLAGYNSPL